MCIPGQRLGGGIQGTPTKVQTHVPTNYFNPRSPCGELPPEGNRLTLCMSFQSTLPVRGATAVSSRACATVGISIHAPRAGSDRGQLRTRLQARDFNPRSPCGERRKISRTASDRFRFQSTLPVRGATDNPSASSPAQKISIHAPRAGSDGEKGHPGLSLGDFNPRSPCGERPHYTTTNCNEHEFQSTLPVRGATCIRFISIPHRTISIHAPRAGSDHSQRGSFAQALISIHAPRAGSDCAGGNTPMLRLISIHAPRAGSDCWWSRKRCSPGYFNPRSPCGERPELVGTVSTLEIFQSTLPVRGATQRLAHARIHVGISIHAPRAGSDTKHLR